MGLLSKAAAKADPRGHEDRAGKPASEGAEGRKSFTEEDAQRIRGNITQYYRDNSPFQGIILENSGQAGEETGRKFLDQVTDMILYFGISIGLPGGRSLVLLPASLDRELIAHRISHSLNIPSLGTFWADDPEGAMKELAAFL
ncbi:MAG: hypothetical protein LBP42_08100 [Treponema sp.]|jgi:hypothetical protein|nr:hypothetical protein [Treponema sp.]